MFARHAHTLTPPRSPLRTPSYPAVVNREDLPRLFFTRTLFAILLVFVVRFIVAPHVVLETSCSLDAVPTDAFISLLKREDELPNDATAMRREEPPTLVAVGSLPLTKCPSPFQEAGGRAATSPGAKYCNVETWQVCIAF